MKILVRIKRVVELRLRRREGWNRSTIEMKLSCSSTNALSI
jgi:hypothetical protein